MRTWMCFAVGLVLLGQTWPSPSATVAGESVPAEQVERVVAAIGQRGVVALAGNFDIADVQRVVKNSEYTVYCQSQDPAYVDELRKTLRADGLLGHRVFVDLGSLNKIQLANNLVDALLVAATDGVPAAEIQRVLRPRGLALVGDKVVTKPTPKGIDEWTHPYHGPDNNPQSRDELARGEFHTQFIGTPKFSPMPEQSVVAGGRIYKALGHIAHRKNQNEHLNTLLCINAYNGTIHWKRKLPEGFMIHRNTMVANADGLFMGDDKSCKFFDGRTGDLQYEITVPKDLVDGPVWKWMSIQDGILYALIGNAETKIETQKAVRRGLGHWPWGMWEGHDYKDPKLSFGFGRTFVAIDLETRNVVWHHKSKRFLDARAVCMNQKTIFSYCPGKELVAIDRESGARLWSNSDEETLAAIGPNQRAQHYVTGYATTCYMKCSEDYLFFAGPQRKQMSVLHAKNGKVAWTHPDGNLQIVLRDDGIYAAGPKSTGVRLDYETGKILGTLPTRRACTRATGGVDSVFYRASGGTIRVLTDGENAAHHIAAMRPPCQDGVLISNGHLYWGPWMCGCQLSLYGNIGLGPASPQHDQADDNAWQAFAKKADLKPLTIHKNDWPAFRGNNARTDEIDRQIPAGYRLAWSRQICQGKLPTAPVAADGLTFIADRTGAVTCLDGKGEVVWQQHTGGPIYFPPAIARDRVVVGSADGRVYAFAAHSGDKLWSYRVAPTDERILVFGELISRWPVAGGVVVQDSTVYAAAGIVNFDGTYVVGLNVVTGKLQMQNSTSGKLAQRVNGGISVQGNLSIEDGELRFLGGGVYETARFNLKTLECINQPLEQLNAGFRTAFYPYYPDYGKFVSLQASCPEGLICHAASYEGNYFGNMALQAKPKQGTTPTSEAARRVLRRRGQLTPAKFLWQDARNRRFTSFVLADNALLACGHTEQESDEPFVATVNVRNGSDIWKHALPADTVKGGVCLDHQDRLLVSLEDGSLHCFLPDPDFADASATAPSTTALPAQPSIEFLAKQSMRPFKTGTKMGKFPSQSAGSAAAPFSGSGIYFDQRQGQDKEIVYRVRSARPIKRVHYKGAATFKMRMQILSGDGSVAISHSGPHNQGNVYSQHSLAVPASSGHDFLLRFHNEASVWFYIENLELEF